MCASTKDVPRSRLATCRICHFSFWIQHIQLKVTNNCCASVPQSRESAQSIGIEQQRSSRAALEGSVDPANNYSYYYQDSFKMGLGGITRDSIADLASLVHDDDDTTVTNTNDAHLRRTASLVRSGRPSSFTSENKVASAEGDFFTEEEGEERRCVLNDDGEQVG